MSGVALGHIGAVAGFQNQLRKHANEASLLFLYLHSSRLIEMQCLSCMIAAIYSPPNIILLQADVSWPSYLESKRLWQNHLTARLSELGVLIITVADMISMLKKFAFWNMLQLHSKCFCGKDVRIATFKVPVWNHGQKAVVTSWVHEY